MNLVLHYLCGMKEKNQLTFMLLGRHAHRTHPKYTLEMFFTSQRQDPRLIGGKCHLSISFSLCHQLCLGRINLIKSAVSINSSYELGWKSDLELKLKASIFILKTFSSVPQFCQQNHLKQTKPGALHSEQVRILSVSSE